jgi:hypothetical protein
MKNHLYRITVEHLEDPTGKIGERPPLVFSARNHDDLFSIVDRMRSRNEFDSEESAALAIGLKLLTEVMINNKGNGLFKSLQPGITEFITELKNRR